MDDAVAEVFASMLDRSCDAVEPARAASTCISATITFSGTLEARCVVEFPPRSAQNLATAFLGSGDATAVEWDDAMIADAVGEFCNMIAGGWKKRLGAPAWSSNLSVPSIETGPTRLRHTAATYLRRNYAFDDSPFVVDLTLA